MKLYTALNDTNNITITIWSSNNDYVNVDMLRKLIFSFGLDKVYIDVPDELSDKLDLSNVPDKASITILHVSVIILCLIWANL